MGSGQNAEFGPHFLDDISYILYMIFFFSECSRQDLDGFGTMVCAECDFFFC